MYCQSIIFKNLKTVVLDKYKSIYQGSINKGTSKKELFQKDF